MGQQIGLVALIVPEYQAGLDFFVGALGFELVEDRVDGSKRWIVVRPRGAETGLVIARAVGAEQKAAIGNQSGGRVGFFLQTDDFDRDAARITAAGGTFEEKPRDEVFGRVAVFRDPFGNRWDLIQPAT
jgi:catechol 2,3-dioxygenase-like lactoylglutathione lyase family enzyme